MREREKEKDEVK